MDNQQNNQQNNPDDNIRAPDPVIRETLINDLYSFNNDDNDLSDDELTQMMEISKREYAVQQEQELIKIIKEEMKERLQKFESVKQKLRKLAIYDKQTVYETVLSIIDLFEEGFVTSYTLTKEEYTKIFAILHSIRLTDSELQSLRKLIVSED
jgi:hypothetical protein